MVFFIWPADFLQYRFPSTESLATNQSDQMNRAFWSSLLYLNSQNGACFFSLQDFKNSLYKINHYLFIHTRPIIEKLYSLTLPGLATAKCNFLHFNIHGRKNQQILMFKPQGGSLHTDENMTERAPSFCCMAPGPDGKKTKAKRFTLRSKRNEFSPYSNQ